MHTIQESIPQAPEQAPYNSAAGLALKRARQVLDNPDSSSPGLEIAQTFLDLYDLQDPGGAEKAQAEELMLEIVAANQGFTYVNCYSQAALEIVGDESYASILSDHPDVWRRDPSCTAVLRYVAYQDIDIEVEDITDYLNEHLETLTLQEMLKDLDRAKTFYLAGHVPHAFAEKMRELKAAVEANEGIASEYVEEFAEYACLEGADDILAAACKHLSVAEKFLELTMDMEGNGYLDEIGETVDNIAYIETLRAKIAESSGLGYIEQEEGLRTILEENPYRSDAYVMDEAKHHRRDELLKILRSWETDESPEWAVELGVVVGKVAEVIETELEEVSQKTGMPSWKDILTRQTARFLALSDVTEDQLRDKDYLEEVSELITTTVDKLRIIYTLDTTLYDKVFQEFDELRETEPSQEVYLGRDGIYAYLGRKALRAARLQHDYAAEKKHMLPKYLVYPRDFRDYMSDPVKRAYLKDKDISPQRAHFYDTGFEGTIPADIMRATGWIDMPGAFTKRTHLLSSDDSRLMVKGIPPSDELRKSIADDIEHRDKPEETAAGVYVKRGIRGQKIEYYAPPASPHEQFRYNCVRQALLRHYYLHERAKQNQSSAQMSTPVPL